MTALDARADSLRDQWLLTAEQVAAFDRDGYLVLRDRIPADLVERLQDATARWLDTAEEGKADHLYANRPNGRVLWRIDYIHDKGEPVTLELLGSPAVLGIAESLAGPDFVPTYESLVVKVPGDGAAVPWHQDAVHERRHRLFNVDVYLDHSRAGAGALHVVPGSQKQRTDACSLAETYGYDLPGAIEVEMRPGDVLIHDDMVVHGSPATGEGSSLRRTIYLEFRAAQSILEDGPWSPEWMDARLRLLPLALAENELQHGTSWEWAVSDGLRPKSLGDKETELRVVHTAHTPGEWCSAG
ncbi:MAG: phytanoyl-CoA dioxygenase family protein [Candidatus Nanopelagicales bacterium]|jgi:ectoine hydroxylase-related dioxygenase (phytanoyl-CoA dioxygenase family)